MHSSQKNVYTCPMHPKVRKASSGSCPICGMALEPLHITSHGEENIELKQMSWRLWISAALTVPLILLTIHPQGTLWVQALLATPIVIWGGMPFFIRAWVSLVTRKLNMFTLIALGIGSAYLYSLCALFFPEYFNEVYFESAAVITTLVLLGQVLELRARAKTSLAIKALLDLSPKMATLVLSDATEQPIGLDEVQVGHKLRVKPGEKIPVDGIILKGSSVIDESMITGESIPLEKKEGNKVIGGTINKSGSFIMRAEKVGSETLLARIVHLVSEAQRTRAPIQDLADTVSSYFVPAVILVSLLTFIFWGLFGPPPAFMHGIINAVAVLIIACPCALGLATPMSIMVGVGRGAKMGILIKDAKAIEEMSKVDTVVIDKTGTLTEGKVTVHAVIAHEVKEETLLQMAASVERLSEHPFSQAIVSYAMEKNIHLLLCTNFIAILGKGVQGTLQGKKAAVGNEALMETLGIDVSPLKQEAESLRHEGHSVLFAALENRLLGLFSLADTIKPSTYEAIELLHKEKIRIVMCTGDNEITARNIASKLHIDEMYAGVLPEKKIETIKKLQSQGHIVAMAGDGINDAPALAQANVGIAMGTGTDAAMESASITLVQGDLRGIVRARNLSLAIRRNIKQNLAFAFVYNILCVPIAAGILYPFFGILLSPMIASAAMTFSSVSVIWNALRLRRHDK